VGTRERRGRDPGLLVAIERNTTLILAYDLGKHNFLSTESFRATTISWRICFCVEMGS